MAPRPRLRQSLSPLVRSTYCTARHPLPRTLSDRSTLIRRPKPEPGEGDSPDETVNGWVRSVRVQKNVAFATITDGTLVGGVQVVVPKPLEQGLTVGCSASFKGDWTQNPKNLEPEFKVKQVTWIGESDAESFPVPNTKQGIPLPLLRHNAHLRTRKQDMASVLRVRSEMNWAMTNYFRNEGYLKVEAPIITSSDCEGGGEVFKVVDSTAPPPPPPPPSPTPPTTTSPDRSKYLTVSSQLHLEAIAASHPRVYAFSPCFRAEKSDTARHLQEFWMLEAELGFLASEPGQALEQVMNVVEQAIRSITRHVVEQQQQQPHQQQGGGGGGGKTTTSSDFDYLASSKNGQQVQLRDRVSSLLEPSSPYARMTYTSVIERLEKVQTLEPERFKYKVQWGTNLQTEHEKYLAEELVRGPVFVTDYPSHLKPFYMLRNPSNRVNDDGEDGEEENRETTACFDLLVPQLGELAGGSLRIHSPSELVTALRTNPNLKERDYDWYLDLRKFGTTRHGGFGLGWERLVAFLTGMNNVRECIAFPRAGEGSRF